MKQPLEIMTPDRRHPVRKVLREALLVAAAGIVLAFGANLVSPRGLALTRNYFPAGINRPVPAATGVGSPRGVANTNSPAAFSRSTSGGAIEGTGTAMG